MSISNMPSNRDASDAEIHLISATSSVAAQIRIHSPLSNKSLSPSFRKVAFLDPVKKTYLHRQSFFPTTMSSIIGKCYIDIEILLILLSGSKTSVALLIKFYFLFN